MHDELIIQSRRRAKAGGSVVSLVDADKCLFRRALGGGHNAITTQPFRFVESGGILWAGHGGNGRAPELTGGFQNERLALAPMRAKSERKLAEGILAAMAGLVAGYPFGAHGRFGMLRPITRAQRKNCRRCASAQINAVVLRLWIDNLRKVLGQPGLKAGRLRRKQRAPCIMGVL